ncbi:MAG: 4-alpha-glucanotransferase, partial [Acidimicrobiia bacterium]|nr:4-alpha-glucanotransferase [Acidimicrobiia bacterium]
MEDLPEDLERLADAAGVVPRYLSDQGEPMASAPEDVRATLALLGLDLSAGADAARDALLAERAARPLEPVVVAWDGVLPHVPVRAPGGRHGELWLELEGGGVLGPPAAWGAPPLPFGEHRLVAEGPDWRSEAVVLAAPTVPHEPAGRRWGVFLPLHALRTARTQGVGDLADLGRLFDWAHERGAAAVVTLPLLATWLDHPAEVSPYSPVSRRAWNELYLDLDGLGAPSAGPSP